MPSLRLVSVDHKGVETEEMVLRPALPTSADGIACSQFDLGAPAVREYVQERAGVDGVLDRSEFLGSRTFTAELAIFGTATQSKEQLLDRLQALAVPSRRLYVYVRRDTWTAERRMYVRPMPFAVVSDKTAATRFKASLSFVGPAGVLEATTMAEQAVRPVTGSPGISFPLRLRSVGEYPPSGGFSFAPGTSVPHGTIPVAGTLPTPPRFRIFGRARNPAITLRGRTEFDVSRVLRVITDIPTGQHLTLDMDSRTALLNDDPAHSLYGAIDWEGGSEWYNLLPGNNEIDLDVANPDSGTELRVQWRSRWI